VVCATINDRESGEVVMPLLLNAPLVSPAGPVNARVRTWPSLPERLTGTK
jgi:hypothetical protein